MGTKEVVHERVHVLVHRFHWCTLALSEWLSTNAQSCDVLIVVMGSTQSSISEREPMPFNVRESLRARCVEGLPVRVLLLDVPDLLYQPHAWGALLQRQCDFVLGGALHNEKWLAAPARVACTWQFWFHHPDMAVAAALNGPMAQIPDHILSAERQLRHCYFAKAARVEAQGVEPANSNVSYADLCLPGVAQVYSAFQSEPSSRAEWQRCQADYQAAAAFRAEWQDAPYPPIFHTVDALVKSRLVSPQASGDEVSGSRDYVLLIKRGRAPGEGLWAIPGGFLDVSETRYAGALRELLEETGLCLLLNDGAVMDGHGARVTARVSGNLLGDWVVDAPRRSSRGRIVTSLYVFDLGELEALPPVVGADDAAHAEWVTLDAIRAELCFEDHCFLLSQASLRFGWSAA
jgi:ADP-ribose pyrophosphatase YjhB (NUDIX family)